MTSDELNKLIKSGKLNGAFLFYGEEQYLLGKKIDTISKKIITPGTEIFNVSEFSGKKVDISEVIAAIDQFPQMSEMRLIIVKNSELLSNASTNAYKRLRETILRIPPYVCLIFVEQSFDKKKLKNVKFIEEVGDIVEFKYQPVNKLVFWITERFRKNEKLISDSDASYIIRCCGQSLGRLELECDKLLGYIGGRQTVTKEDIDAAVSKSVECRTYDMLDNMIAGRSKTAQEQLKYLRDTCEEPFYILGLLMSRLSELLMCKLLKEDGLSTAQISTYFDFKRPDFAVNNLIRESRNFDEKYLKRMIDRGLYYDLECKSGRLAPWAAVEMYLAELVNRRVS